MFSLSLLVCSIVGAEQCYGMRKPQVKWEEEQVAKSLLVQSSVSVPVPEVLV